MKKIILIIIGLLLYAYLFPVLKVNNKTPFCHVALISQNKVSCNLAGCIWGSGDLTGPPFCGAYK